MKHTNITAKKYIIKDVELWNFNGINSSCTVVVEDGRVSQVLDQAPAVGDQWLLIDGKGSILLPAGVDPQVHTRVPGQVEKETPESVIKAAIAGGVACILTMPNTKPVIDDEHSYKLAQTLLAEPERKFGVKTLISVAISRGQKGQEPVNYDLLADLGASAYTDDGVGVVDEGIMRAVFAASARTGLPVLQHAEMPGHGAVLAEGPIQHQLGIKAYPRAAEIDMVARDLRLLADYPDAKYHVLHISCRETIDLVARAKAQGLHATSEVTPHHLWLCAEDIRDKQTSYKMNPPLRGAADRTALQLNLANGLIDFVSTDHAPHEQRIKGDNFKTAAFGTLGLETSLRVLLALKKRGVLTAERVVEVFAKKPAEFLQVAETYGQIASGRPFYGVLVAHPTLDYPVTLEDLPGQSKNSCFLGHSLPGRITHALFGEHLHQLHP